MRKRFSLVHQQIASDWLLSEIVYVGQKGISEREIFALAKQWEYDFRIIRKLLNHFLRNKKIIKVGNRYWAFESTRKKLISKELCKIARLLL